MCVIVIKEQGKVISRSVLRQMVASNPHGFGSYNCETGRIQRSMHDTQFLRWGRSRDKMVLHARISTQGTISRANCHPFEFVCSKGIPIAVFHNGHCYGYGCKQRSDTADMVSQLNGKSPLRVWEFLSKLAHNGNRFCVCYLGQTYTFGRWESHADGVLVSNTNFIPPAPVPKVKGYAQWQKEIQTELDDDGWKIRTSRNYHI